MSQSRQNKSELVYSTNPRHRILARQNAVPQILRSFCAFQESLSMRSAISSASRSSRAKNHRSRRFIASHLTIWLVLLILGAAVLSPVLAGALDESRKSAAAGQKLGTKSVTDVLTEKGYVKVA